MKTKKRFFKRHLGSEKSLRESKKYSVRIRQSRWESLNLALLRIELIRLVVALGFFKSILKLIGTESLATPTPKNSRRLAIQKQTSKSLNKSTMNRGGGRGKPIHLVLIRSTYRGHVFYTETGIPW